MAEGTEDLAEGTETTTKTAEAPSRRGPAENDDGQGWDVKRVNPGNRGGNLLRRKGVTGLLSVSGYFSPSPAENP